MAIQYNLSSNETTNQIEEHFESIALLFPSANHAYPKHCGKSPNDIASWHQPGRIERCLQAFPPRSVTGVSLPEPLYFVRMCGTDFTTRDRSKSSSDCVYPFHFQEFALVVGIAAIAYLSLAIRPPSSFPSTPTSPIQRGQVTGKAALLTPAPVSTISTDSQ